MEAAPALFSAEQIKVPEELPDILKQWTKSAIRANPEDLIRWSASYFASKTRERAELLGVEVPPIAAEIEAQDA